MTGLTGNGNVGDDNESTGESNENEGKERGEAKEHNIENVPYDSSASSPSSATSDLSITSSGDGDGGSTTWKSPPPYSDKEEIKGETYIGQGSLTPADSSEDESDDKVESPARSRSPSSSSVSSAEVEAANFQQRYQRFVPTAETASSFVVNLFTIVASAAVFGIFLLGSYDYFKNVEENKCDMTWMYQRPYYIQLKLGNGLDEKFPMYRLYAYTEGERSLEQMSRDSYKFNGIPVLFIPGNAGSYQQVRSLASVALWKYLDAGTPFHFDFFTLDLNEEFSALYGYSLQQQVEFARQAVSKIVNLYEEFHRVVVVGHSMGGVIAKAVAIDDSGGDSGGSLVNLILTLATPHLRPVILMDPEQDLFYYAVSRNWTKMISSAADTTADELTPASTNPNPLTLVTIAGGDRDHLVLPKLTRWNPYAALHTITTAIPGVWASTDHLCIVWCKQLVLTLVRSLFDLVEFHQRNKYFYITEKSETRLQVLKYHLQERSSGKSYHSIGNNNNGNRNAISLIKNAAQVEVTSGIHCVPGGQRMTYVLFPTSVLETNATGDDAHVVALTTNTKDKHWLMGCTEQSRGQCTQVESLADFGKVIPHMRRRRKMATVPLSYITQRYSHLVVKMDMYQFRTCVMLESYLESERTVPLGSELKVKNGIFYNLTLPSSAFGSIISNLVAWKVNARPDNPNEETCPESHNLLAQFNHGNFQQSRYLKNESLVVRSSDWNVTESWVTLFLEPTCSYVITTRIAFVETAGQVFRLLARFLPSFYASVLLMTLYFQKDPANWSSFHVLLLSNAYNLSILPGFCVAVILHFLPTDWPLMVEEKEYSAIVPIFCYMIAYCLVLAVSSLTWYTIITGGTALHAVVVRVLTTRFGSWIPKLMSNHRGFTSVTEHVTEAAFEMTLTRFPLTIAVLLLGLSFATCGSLGISLALILYLVKLFKIYEDLLEDLLKAKIANVKDSLSPMNFHFCCFMLWLVLGVLNLPSLLHWTRTTFTVQPEWDLSMYLCLLLLPTVAVLWQEFVPQIDPSVWHIHRYVFYGVGLACVLWGTHRLYVTSFLITFVFLTMALCQMVSVMMNSLSQSIAAQQQPPPPPPQAADSSSNNTGGDTIN